MKRWRRSAIWATLLVGLTLVLTTVLGALHLSRFHESFRAQFESRAALSAQIFTESVGQASDETRLQTLTQAFVRGDVLFAQVVQNGVVIAEDRTESVLDADLEVTDNPGQRQRRQRTLQRGLTYFELVRPLDGQNGSSGSSEPSYVRIGFSLERVNSALQSEALLTIGVGLALVLAVSLAAGLYLVRTRPRAADAVPASDSGRAIEPTHANGASTASHNDWIRLGTLQIDPRGKEVYVDDHVVELTPTEYDLVRLLASEPGRVFSNREILEEVWASQNTNAPTSKDVKQYVYLLRQKLERDAGRPELIVTVRGFGYKLALQGSSSTNGEEDAP